MDELPTNQHHKMKKTDIATSTMRSIHINCCYIQSLSISKIGGSVLSKQYKINKIARRE